MKLQPGDLRLKSLIEDTVILLCKNGIEYETEFLVEGLVVITVDKEKTFHASIREHITKSEHSESGSKTERVHTICNDPVDDLSGPVAKRPRSQVVQKVSQATVPERKLPSKPMSEIKVRLTPLKLDRANLKLRRILVGSEESSVQISSVDSTEKRTDSVRIKEEPVHKPEDSSSESSGDDSDEESPEPRVTRRANRIAEEQSKIQTRGSSTKIITPSPSTNKIKLVTASKSTGKPLVKKEGEEASTPSLSSDGKHAKTNGDHTEKSGEPNKAKVITPRVRLAWDNSENYKGDSGDKSRQSSEVQTPTSKVNVREKTRELGTLASSPTTTASPISVTYTQLRSPNDSIVKSSQDFMSIAIPSQVVGGQIIQYAKDKPVQVKHAVENTLASILPESALNEVVKQVMERMEPGLVKNTSGQDNPIKVNLGLNQLRPVYTPQRCPSCRNLFASPEEVLEHECSGEAVSNRVFRCDACASMFLMEENFRKHVTNCKVDLQ